MPPPNEPTPPKIESKKTVKFQLPPSEKEVQKKSKFEKMKEQMKLSIQKVISKPVPLTPPKLTETDTSEVVMKEEEVPIRREEQR